MKTYQELIEQRDSLEALISEAKSKVRTTVVMEVERLVEEFDIASREIFGAMSVSETAAPETGQAAGEIQKSRDRRSMERSRKTA